MAVREIPLDYFKNATNHYHIYKINSSTAAEELHHHDYFQLCYVTRGHILHQQEGKEVTLVKGDAFIIPPGFTHSILSRNPKSEFYSLSFQEELFYPGFVHSSAYKFLAALHLHTLAENRLDVRLRICLDEAQQQNAEMLLGCLLKEFQLNLPRDSTMAGSLIAALLILLSRAYFAEPGGQRQLQDINEYHDSILACIRYIDGNYAKALSLTGLARRFMLSRSTFALLFPQIAGMPLKQYINQKRIGHAVSLCAVDTLSCGEIAKMVGYEEFSTFYRNFVRIVGISPAQYRRNLRTGDELVLATP
jgi:AraC-like DNA-binding protein